MQRNAEKCWSIMVRPVTSKHVFYDSLLKLQISLPLCWAMRLPSFLSSSPTEFELAQGSFGSLTLKFLFRENQGCIDTNVVYSRCIHGWSIIMDWKAISPKYGACRHLAVRTGTCEDLKIGPRESNDGKDSLGEVLRIWNSAPLAATLL